MTTNALKHKNGTAWWKAVAKETIARTPGQWRRVHVVEDVGREEAVVVVAGGEGAEDGRPKIGACSLYVADMSHEHVYLVCVTVCCLLSLESAMIA